MSAIDVSLYTRPAASRVTAEEGGDEANPEATGGAAGLGLAPGAQAEEVLGREEVKEYLKGVKVCLCCGGGAKELTSFCEGRQTGEGERREQEKEGGKGVSQGSDV